MPGRNSERVTRGSRVLLTPLAAVCLALTAVSAAHAQLLPFGLQQDTIVALTAERRDAGSGSPSRWVFAATSGGAVHRNQVSGSMMSWDSLGMPVRRVAAMTVQRWGVGPMDGLRLLVAEGSRDENGGVLWVREVGLGGGPADRTWYPADAGLPRGQSTDIGAADAYYYTGHLMPQPQLCGGRGGLWFRGGSDTAWSAATVDTPVDTVRSIDAAPHWFGTLAWAAGSSGGAGTAWRSTDAGRSWERRLRLDAIDGHVAEQVVIHPRTPDTVFVLADGRIHRSTDGGMSWDLLLPRDPFFVPVAMAIDPRHPEHLYLTGAAGPAVLFVLHSSDAGRNWEHVYQPGGMYIAEGTSLLFFDVDDAGGSGTPERGLLIGTSGTGVWLYRVPDPTSVRRAPRLPAAPELTLTPNPARGRVAIRVSGVHAWMRDTAEHAGSTLPGHAELRLVDVLGRVVRSVTLAPDGSGAASGLLDTSTLPAGTYVAHAWTATSAVSRRLLITR